MENTSTMILKSNDGVDFTTSKEILRMCNGIIKDESGIIIF
jgi:hypothetical protein